MTDTFDPKPYMKKIRTRQGIADYLIVPGRIAWFHHDRKAATAGSPDGTQPASILTEMLKLDDSECVFRAIVTDWRGVTATGHGHETKADFPDYVMKAETKALGRALAVLGYGTHEVDLDEGAEPDGRQSVADSPRERPAPAPAPREPDPPKPSTLPATRRGGRPLGSIQAVRPEPPSAAQDPPESTGGDAEGESVVVSSAARVRAACASIGIAYDSKASSGFVARQVAAKTGIEIPIVAGAAKAADVLDAIERYRATAAE